MDILFYFLSFCFSIYLMFVTQNSDENVARYPSRFYRRKGMANKQEKLPRYSGYPTRNEHSSFSVLNPRVSKDVVNPKQGVNECRGQICGFQGKAWYVRLIVGKLAMSSAILLREALHRPIISAHGASKSVVSRNDVTHPLAKTLCVSSEGDAK